jgi:Ca-activated chloride channel family protein
MLRGFHFLHPSWLLALPPLLGLLAWFVWRQRTAGNWSQVIDADLLPALRLSDSGRHQSPWWLIGLAWTAAAVALAGPAWQHVQSPAFRAPDNWVLLLDLSPSMASTDVSPDRATRARYAIDDLLNAAHDARVALIVFAGEPHVVVPLTEDVATLRTLLPPLAPGIMPEAGDDLAPGLDQAGQLLRAAGARHGHVVVFTDGFADMAQALSAAQRLRAQNADVDVVGIGDRAGVATPGVDALPRLASVGGGAYWTLNQLPRLIAHLQAAGGGVATPGDTFGEARRDEGIRLDVWRNDGFWLLPPLLLCAVMLARRGWI